jgi:hypothetical protein
MKFTFDNRGADSPLVEAMWRTTSDAEGSFTSTAIATWELVFTRSNGAMRATLRGPETFSSPALVPADAEFIGIQFKLGTYMPALPTHQFVDRAIELLGQGGRRTFGFLGKVWEIPRGAIPSFERPSPGTCRRSHSVPCSAESCTSRE